MKKHLAAISLGSLILTIVIGGIFAQKKPEIRLSAARVKTGDTVLLTGTGFTPGRMAISHLRRPDGSDYNPLRLRIDARGEIVHKIDTVMLDHGTFEVWVEDEPSA